MSIDHQLSELVASITIVIQNSLFIDPKIIIALILLLWKNAIPSGVAIDWETIRIFQVNKKKKDNCYDKLNTNGNQGEYKLVSKNV